MTMSFFKINVCGLGNPRSPSTWSGTPNSICHELEKEGRLGITFSSQPPKMVDIWVFLFSMIYYGRNKDWRRGKFSRWLASWIVKNKLRSENPQIVLHFGTLDCPVDISDNNIHFLFCDSTWNLWQNNATNTATYSKKLLYDAERLEKKSYEKMRHIFSISQYVKDNLISHYQIPPEKITVVGTGRGKIEPFFGEKNYSTGTILFVAKERFQDKGGDIVLEGFKLAYRKNSKLNLIILGDDRYKEEIPDIPGVTVHGRVPWDMLQALFNEAALFAMPALNEPWGLVYLEALSCKAPILGLRRNSLPEITQQGKYGFLVDEPSPKEFSEKILEAYSDPIKMKKMGEEGQQYVLNMYSWNKTVNKIIQGIDESI